MAQPCYSLAPISLGHFSPINRPFQMTDFKTKMALPKDQLEAELLQFFVVVQFYFTRHKEAKNQRLKTIYNFYHRYCTAIVNQVSSDHQIDLDTLSDRRSTLRRIAPRSLPDIAYITRDWGHAEESERQVGVICNALSPFVTGGNALFLGAGVGRVTAEFLNRYDRITAVEKSISMAHSFVRLVNQEHLDIYEVNTKNIRRASDRIIPIRAAIPPKLKAEIHKKLTYVIADAEDLPFENIFNSVYSIYFSDVMTPRRLLEQVNKVLVGSGLFIHFGPLNYFFKDENQMLSVDEFKQLFENNGYTTMADEIVPTSHLESAHSLRKVIFENWLFVAKRA